MIVGTLEGPTTILFHVDGSRNQVESLVKSRRFWNQEFLTIIPINFLYNISIWYVNPYLVNRNQQGITGIILGIKPRFLHDSESHQRELTVVDPSVLIYSYPVKCTHQVWCWIPRLSIVLCVLQSPLALYFPNSASTL